jgi:hypothetical protein
LDDDDEEEEEVVAGRSLVLGRWVMRRWEEDGWKEVERGRRDRMTARDFRGRRELFGMCDIVGGVCL